MTAVDRKILFLDQHVWVLLAKLRATSETIVEQKMRNLVERGLLVVPLSAQNYLELWNRGKDGSRFDVAAVMRDVSQYWTFAGLQHIEDTELSLVLSAWKLDDRSPQPMARNEVVQCGANHAFTSVTGRLRLVESIFTHESPEGARAEPSSELLQLIESATPDQWEWFNLVGFEGLHDFPGMEITPEHRLGDGYVEMQDDAKKLVLSIGGESGFVGKESLLVRYLAGVQLDDWSSRIHTAWSEGELRRQFLSPSDGLAFVHAVPSAHVRLQLESAAHQNLQYKFRQHDRGDVYSISQTLPYSDAIYPDKHWGHLVRSQKLDREFGSIVIGSIGELSTYLDGISAA